MKNTVTIYTLSHPVTKYIFYVGQTTMTLKQRLSCHVTCNDPKFHLHPYIKQIIKETGKRPLIEAVDFGLRENKRDLEEYWVQQFAAWGFNLLNKRHFVNKSFCMDRAKIFKWKAKLLDEERNLIDLLFTRGDCDKLAIVLNVTNERVRQIINHNTMPAKFKEKIIEFYKTKGEAIIENYKKLVA